MTVAPRIGRRTLLKSLAISSFVPVLHRAEAAARRAIPLGFSLYGTKSLSLAESLDLCAEVGYDSIELALMPDFPAAPERLSPAARKQLCHQLAERGLEVPALMENLALLANDTKHRENLDRLKAAAQLAHDLNDQAPPLIETVLGGRPAEWPDVRQAMADRLASWVEVLADARVVLAIKPHVSGAMHRVEHAIWLIQQVGSPWLKATYDYSHYRAQQLELETTLAALLPHTAFVHVKDTRLTNGKFEFLLPGEGDIDYAAYFRQLHAGGYRGHVVVEVSGQIWNRAGYDPASAALRSFGALDAARRG